MMIGIGTTDIDCSKTLNVAGFMAHSVFECNVKSKLNCIELNIVQSLGAAWSWI